MNTKNPNRTLFGDWLQSQLDERDMSQADLARRMGKKTGVISNLINNKRHLPSVESCQLISRALNIPLEEVYRAANILPETEQTDALTEAIVYMVRNLDPEERQEILDYVKYKSERQSKDPHPFNTRNSKRTVEVSA